MTLKEVKEEIYRFETIKNQLEEQEREVHRQAARKFVGKCYKSNKGRVIKIIDVPRTRSAMTHVDYNKYQFPAVILHYPEKLPRNRYIIDDSGNFRPIFYTTVYLDIEKGIPGDGVLFQTDQYEEITEEEFETEFDKCMEHFKELIDMRKPEPLSEEEFIAKYCRWCGTQRCIGPSDELAVKGCEHYQKHFGGNAK